MERFFNHIVCGFYFLDKFLLGSENWAIRRLMSIFAGLQAGTMFFILSLTIGLKRMLSWGTDVFVCVFLVFLITEFLMACRYCDKHIEPKFKDYYSEFRQYPTKRKLKWIINSYLLLLFSYCFGISGGLFFMAT